MSSIASKQGSLPVARPQTNGQAESTNKQILNGLKKKLDNAKGLWADELLAVLWAIRITEKSTNEEALFMLVSESKVVLLVEVSVHTYCISTFQENLNNKALKDALDLLLMVRGDAYLREEIVNLQMIRFYNCKFKERSMKLGDLVLQKMECTEKGAIQGKFTLN